jgi:hypothetical protein
MVFQPEILDPGVLFFQTDHRERDRIRVWVIISGTVALIPFRFTRYQHFGGFERWLPSVRSILETL